MPDPKCYVKGQIIVDNQIIIRKFPLENWNVSSAYIQLCDNEIYENQENLLLHFDIDTLLHTLYRESHEYSVKALEENYKEVKRSKENSELFEVAYQIDEEYAVSIGQHIYLHKLDKKANVYGTIVPWYYQYGQRYIGDSWWSTREEILSDICSLSIIEFLKKYKGF